MQRAQNWQKLFNASSGFIQPRLSNGRFLPGFEPGTSAPLVDDGQAGFVEGNTWQYTWMVPFNLRGLFDAIGGNAEVVQPLDTLFSELTAAMHRPHASIGNEPSFAAPWAYTFAGAPWRTQAIVRKVLVDLFPDTPVGQPGNDDLGAVSAWYVWAALGLYPAIPGVDGLVIGSPSFTEMTIALSNGRVVRIRADHLVNSAPYVQRVRLNGQEWSSPWIPLTALQTDTSTLDISLGSAPSPTWGADARNAPPSFPEGQTPLIGLSQPADVVPLVGGVGELMVGVRNITAGTQVIRWRAEMPPGVTLEPPSGTLVAEGLRMTSARVRVSGSPTLASSQITLHFESPSPSDALADQAIELVAAAATR